MRLPSQRSCTCSKDYYDILQLSRGASESQIKRSYRKLALQYHPVSLPRCSANLVVDSLQMQS